MLTLVRAPASWFRTRPVIFKVSMGPGESGVRVSISTLTSGEVAAASRVAGTPVASAGEVRASSSNPTRRGIVSRTTRSAIGRPLSNVCQQRGHILDQPALVLVGELGFEFPEGYPGHFGDLDVGVGQFTAFGEQQVMVNGLVDPLSTRHE